MKKDFIRFLVTISIFSVSLLLCDRILFLVEDKLYSLQDTKINYALRNENIADIVILGSSRASHHYVPHILTDSLGLTCVNLGEDGQGILYNYPIAHMLLSKKTPKVILYELGWFDWGRAIGDNITTLSIVYGKYTNIDNIIKKIKPNTAKSISIFNTYKYNSIIHKVAINGHETSIPNNGYNPIFGSKKDGSEVKYSDDSDLVIDDYKLTILHQLVSECKEKGVLIIGVSTPRYGIDGDIERQIPIDFCDKVGIPYLDYREATFDVNYFIDNAHLNDNGAKWFSTKLAFDLKQFIKQHEFKSLTTTGS